MNKLMSITGILLLAAMFLAGCSKMVPIEEAVHTLNVSVVLPAVASRASHDGDGDGNFVNRCRLQIWLKDSLCIDRTAPVKNSRAEFSDIFIAENPQYQFLFWADCSSDEFYNTENLKQISFKGEYLGNDDRRDAFCLSATHQEVKDSKENPLMLRRPFAQMNIITTDIADFIQYLLEGRATLRPEFFPESVRVKFRAPKLFDVSLMKGSEIGEFSYFSKIYSDLLSLDAPWNRTLSMDYIFVPDENKFLTDVKFTLEGNAEATAMEFSSIPLMRNYRTCVTGRLLSLGQQAEVTISTEWNGEENAE